MYSGNVQVAVTSHPDVRANEKTTGIYFQAMTELLCFFEEAACAVALTCIHWMSRRRYVYS
jgi:hypothetical protein